MTTTLEIFDVEHGQCSLITFASGAHMLIDCGHNSSSNWRPSTMLTNRGITHLDQLMITNYDEDHASDLVNLRQSISIGILTRNPSVSGQQLAKLKSNGRMGSGITELCNMTSGYEMPVVDHPNFDGMTYKLFWNSYPGDFEDENNLSLVAVLR